MPHTPDRGAFLALTGQSMVIKATLLADEKSMTCPLAPNFTDLGEIEMDVRISIDERIETASESSMRLLVIDKCPTGFSCVNGVVAECDKGHYCEGIAFSA
jgi:hypothetical protein